MKNHDLSPAGRRLLDRRIFLQSSAAGLGGIALTTLLAESGALADAKTPLRPQVDPARPYAPRRPHFTPRASRVLMIFCSGA
jgi:hypothetical protein